MRKSSLSPQERLLETAVRIFGQYGFEGASTRLLAKEAGVNISAIAYYFGDKKGLYRATLEHIVATVRAAFIDRLAPLRSVTSWEDKSESEGREALQTILGAVLSFLLGDKVSLPLAQIFLREQMDPSDDFGVLFDQTVGPMHELATKLIARLSGLPFPSEQATLCTHALIGQIIGFKTHREAALRRLRWKKYGPAEREKIFNALWTNTLFVIEGYRRTVGGSK